MVALEQEDATMKKTFLIIAGSALATGALIKAAPALAQTIPAEANVSVVHTADLDLSSRSGRQQLDRRLISAAGEVCGQASDADLRGKNDVRQCREDVLSAARAKADAMVAGRRGDRRITVAATN